jgi:hypothetical protein
MSGEAGARQTARARLLQKVPLLFPDDSGRRAHATSALCYIPEDTAAVLSSWDDDGLRAAILALARERAGELRARPATLPAEPSSPHTHCQNAGAGTARIVLRLFFHSFTRRALLPTEFHFFCACAGVSHASPPPRASLLSRSGRIRWDLCEFYNPSLLGWGSGFMGFATAGVAGLGGWR